MRPASARTRQAWDNDLRLFLSWSLKDAESTKSNAATITSGVSLESMKVWAMRPATPRPWQAGSMI